MLLRQDREGIAETVGPENASRSGVKNRRVGRRRDLLSTANRFETSQSGNPGHDISGCHQHPLAGLLAATQVRSRDNRQRLHLDRLGQRRHQWLQLEVGRRHVQCQHAILDQVPAVNRKRLLGQQVDRYRVAGKGIQDQHVEPLGLLPLEAQAGITDHHVQIHTATAGRLEIVEVFLGHLVNIRIEFVERQPITRPWIDRQRPDTQANDADPPWCLRLGPQQHPDPRVPAEIAGGLLSSRSLEKLQPVKRATVNQSSDRGTASRQSLLANPQHSVEIPRHLDHISPGALAHSPQHEQHGGGQCRPTHDRGSTDSVR